jgi:retron-type reverse transcriptase
MEKPLWQRPRRLADWLNPDGQRKVHSLVDKVYQPKNLRAAWEKVKANRGSGGIDGQSLGEFEQDLEQHLARLHEELRTDRYHPSLTDPIDTMARTPGITRSYGITPTEPCA